MKLTPQQIQELYKFTRQHYVEHFDVQTELVDHLANNIEQIWTTRPNISFEDARDISFKKFGVFGFMDLVDERKKALNKKYWKLIWHFVKDWFQLPKIIFTALIFSSFYSISKSVNAKYTLLTILAVFCVITTYKSNFLYKKLKSNFKKNGKKWMLEEMIFKTGLGSIYLIPINFINILNTTNFENEIIQSQWFAILLSTIFTFLVILSYISFEVLPKQAEEILKNQYPEYSLV